MKILLRTLLVVAGLLVSGHVLRLSAAEPWVKWTRNPLAIPVTVGVTNIYAQTNAGITISLADGSTTTNGLTCTEPTNAAASFIANLKVRREYLLTVVATNSFESLDLKLTHRPNWTPMNPRGKATRQKTYRLLINRQLSADGLISVYNNTSCSSYSNTWSIELNEHVPANWRLEDGSDNPTFAPGDGAWPEIGPGKSLDKSRTAYSWSVSLGRLMDGQSAGRLTLRDNIISPETFTPTNIYLTCGSELIRDEVQMITKLTNSPVLRQVKAYQTFVDIVDFTNSAEMRFYLTNQVGIQTNSAGHYTNITGNPFVVWALINPIPPSTNNLQIVERRNGINRTNEILFDPNSTNATWTLKYGSGTNQRVETRGVTFSYSPTTNRIETVDIRYSGATSPSYRAIETYRLFTFGFDLVETRVDPDNNPVTSNDLVTSITYYTNPAEDFRYGRPDTMTYPDGYWEKRIYDELFVPGAVKSVLRPDQDTPSNAAAAQEENSVVAEYVDSDGDGAPHKIDHYSNVSTNRGFRTDIMDRFNDVGLDKSFDGAFHQDFPPIFVGNRTMAYDETWGFGYGLHPVFEANDRDADRLSYFHGGTFDPTNNTFTVSTNYIWEGPDWRKSTFFTGYGRTDYTVAELPAIYFTSAEGEPLYDGYVPGASMGVTFYANESWKETEIFRNGSPVLKETYVLTGADTNGEPVFELISKLVYKNDTLGHRTNSTWIDGANTNISRVVYEADYKGTNSFDGDLLLWEKDEHGIKTTNVYDSLKRLVSSTKEGFAPGGGFPGQSDILTTNNFDAYGRTLAQTVSAGSLSYSTTIAFDLAGRVTSQTDTNGLTTAFVYDLGGRKTTKTMPNGRTEIRENYLDRRLKSLTGSGVVAEYHDWLYRPETGWGDLLHPPFSNGSETIKHEIHYGSPTSARVKKEGIDWIGKTTLTETTDWSLTNVVVEYLLFHLSGISEGKADLPIRKYHTRRESYPSENYGYDMAGRISLTAVPLPYYSGNPNASDARVKRTDVRFTKISGAWFQSTTNFVFRIENDATPTILELRRERLNGFSSSNTLSEVTTWDVDTNATIVTATLDRNAKKITEVADPTRSTLNATNITVNGLVQSESSATVSQPTRYAYDALGREVAVTNSLGFVSTTSYNNFGQVTNTTDPSGPSKAYEYYGNGQLGAGQVKIATIGGSKKTYLAYTNIGVWRVWGDVPYPEERFYSQYGEQIELRTYRAGVGWNSSTWPTSPGSPDKTTWTYQDATGLLASKTDNNTNSVSYTYWQGLSLTRAWARGGVTTNIYNDLGELLAIDFNEATPDVSFTNIDITGFNRSGLPQIVQDARGIWRFEYDHGGRMTAMVCTNGAFNGITLSNRYDKVYGKDRIRVTGPPTTVDTTYGFDSYGRLASVTNGSATATYAYLPNSDLLQSTALKISGTTRLTSTRSWDCGTRLRSIQNVADTTPISSHTYGYDSLNRRNAATLADSSTWIYDYNDRDEVTSGKRVWADFSPVSGQQFQYSYDTLGNRTSALSGGDVSGANLRSTIYAANGLNQYTNVTTPGYEDILGVAWASTSVTVDGNGADRKGEYYHREITVTNGSAPVWQNVTVNPPPAGASTNLLFPRNVQTYTYDADGNLTFDGIWTYSWDAENRLIEMAMTNVTSVPNSERKQLKFTYDYLGRRASKKVFTWNGSAFSTSPAIDTKYVYGDWNLQAEYNSASGNALLRSYSWGSDLSGTMDGAGGIGGLVTVFDNVGAANYFPAFDGNGNVTGLVKGDGSIAASYEYGPFGEPIRVQGSFAKANPFRFSTKFTDDETDLIYYGYRYYHPSLGRWINRDPIEEGDCLNLYAAFLNSPGNQLDTDGRGLWFGQKTVQIIAAAAAIYSGYIKGAPVRGPMLEWLRRLQITSRAASEAAAKNLSGKRSGSNGVGGPPKNFYYAGAGFLFELAIVGLVATFDSLEASASLALGLRSGSDPENHPLDSALANYARGETAFGDLDAIDAALQLTGYASGTALVAWEVYVDAGEAFERGFNQ